MTFCARCHRPIFGGCSNANNKRYHIRCFMIVEGKPVHKMSFMDTVRCTFGKHDWEAVGKPQVGPMPMGDGLSYLAEGQEYRCKRCEDWVVRVSA